MRTTTTCFTVGAFILLAACGESTMSQPDAVAPDASLPPGVLAAGLKRPWAVAVDATSVYWITAGSDMTNNSDGALMKARLDGSEVVTLVSPIHHPVALTVNASHVYWATYGVNEPAQLMTASLSGTDVTAIVTLPPGTPTQLAVDATSIYWTDLFAGTVNKANLDGTGMAMLASNQPTPGGIAVDATSVYWVNEGVNQTLGSVVKCSHTGATLTTLAADQKYPVALAIDGERAYWGTSLSESTGAIMTVALTGTGMTTLATGPIVEPWSIAVRDDAVFWLNHGSGTISGGTTEADGAVMRVQRDGTSATVIAPHQPNPRGIALGATEVYWATEGTNEGAYADGTVRHAPAR